MELWRLRQTIIASCTRPAILKALLNDAFEPPRNSMFVMSVPAAAPLEPPGVPPLQFSS